MILKREKREKYTIFLSGVILGFKLFFSHFKDIIPTYPVFIENQK